jgi:GNAT superfamily N-acetyltransferase
MRVREATAGDRDWIERFLDEHGSRRVARAGELVAPLDHPMLVAETGDGRPTGLVTYVVSGDDCEILTLHAVEQWRGAGTALIAAVREMAARRGCKRVWLITTNDNVDALRFYQRRGFRIAEVRPGAVDESRRTLKPHIPPTGEYGIPLRDEIELDQALASARSLRSLTEAAPDAAAPGSPPRTS